MISHVPAQTGGVDSAQRRPARKQAVTPWEAKEGRIQKGLAHLKTVQIELSFIREEIEGGLQKDLAELKNGQIDLSWRFR